MTFDLEAARKAAAKTGTIPCASKAVFVAALDEIAKQEQGISNLQTALVARDQMIAAQAKRIAELEGAAKADDGRLIAAAKNAGIGYFGCDTPVHLAERIAELQSLNEDLMKNGNSLRSRAQEAEKRVAELDEEGKALAEEVKKVTKLKEAIQKTDYDIMTKQRAALKILGKRSAEYKADAIKAKHGYDYARFVLGDYAARNEKLLDALKKLGKAKRERGKALVDERAKYIRQRKYLLADEISHGDPRYSPYDEDDLDHHIIHCKEDQKAAENEARQQLRQEKLL
jgi:hypothetical protein